MSLGIAIVLAMILYIIHANKAWKGALKVTGALIVLGLLGFGGVILYATYSDKREAKKEVAEAKAAQEASDKAAADRWAALGALNLCSPGRDVAVSSYTAPFGGMVECLDSTGHGGPVVSQEACNEVRARFPEYNCLLPPPPPPPPAKKRYLRATGFCSMVEDGEAISSVSTGNVNEGDIVQLLATNYLGNVQVRTKAGDVGWCSAFLFETMSAKGSQ
jgi:hypothetical protein